MAQLTASPQFLSAFFHHQNTNYARLALNISFFCFLSSFYPIKDSSHKLIEKKTPFTQ
eukprot:c51951_g1_i1 orf=4-177(-)